MAYILALIPNIFAACGVPTTATFAAVALSSGIVCILVGLLSDYSIGMAPGVPTATIVSYTICLKMGYSFESALAMIFIASVLFLLITLLGLRKRILDEIPLQLKLAIGIGIGFFLIFIGLQDASIIVSNPTTLVSIGNLASPAVLLALIGILIVFILYIKKVRGALLLALIITVIIGLIMGLFGLSGDLLPSISSNLVSTTVDFSSFGLFLKGFNNLLINPLDFILILLSYLFVSFFDATGSLISFANYCGFTDSDGEIKGIENVFLVDSLGSVIGSVFGVSTLTAFAESSSGIEAGGKTAFVPVIVGIFFILSIFISPLILSLFTSAVTCEILIMIGILMMIQLKDVDYSSFSSVAPVFVTIIMTVLGYSIPIGISFGFITYTLTRVLEKKKVSKLVWVLTVIFLLYLIFGL